MAAFDRTVELAKRQLSRAFTIGGGLPYSGGCDPRRLPERLDNLEEGAFARAVGSTIPAGTEEMRLFGQLRDAPQISAASRD
jgi:hypothetical protein